MSQLDEVILDALTHVTFPKGFAQSEPAWVVTVDGVDYPLWKTDALVVGSGAAGLRAAVELKRRQQNVLIATAGLYMGTSACSGSDKQTLFTAATAGNGDNFTKLAEALASGGAMDHDTAYVEAVGSLHTLGGLQYLGLELPEDRYGAILRYQTDHDEAGRATSCGPRTSRLMVKVLLEEVQRLAIPVLTSATVIKLLHQRDENGEDRVAGAILATGHRAHNPWGLAIVTAPNVVLATGGPGELYRDSVYPHKCFGSLGLALEEGLTLTNLTESQFGIGTPRSTFPWNLSGTYVQVIPYIYSVDAEGNEYNFLADYYRTTQELASNIFRKGYQWPFHATRVMDFGSSLLDMAVAQEQQSGRQVFMDFNRNPEPVPGDMPFSLDRLDDDVRAYLENNDALAPSPIERLQQMNPLSISLYKMHGYDLGCLASGFVAKFFHDRGVSLINSRRITFTIAAVIMMTIGLVSIVENPYIAVLLISIGAFSHQCLSTVAATLGGDLFKKDEVATAVGMAGACAWSGQLIFNLFIGAFVHIIGFAPFFIALAFFDIIGAIALWTLIKVKDEEPQVQLATH